MRTYTEARALIGTRMHASNTNGRARYIRFEENADGSVGVIMFHTEIVTFYPERVEVRTGGHVSPSTFDGIATALNIARVCVGTTKRVPYVLAHRMTEGMWLDYDGRLLGTGSPDTPLAPVRTRSV
jgi:hypothetical protein